MTAENSLGGYDIGSLSLGNTVVTGNALEGKSVVTLNFVNPDHRLPLPFPEGDWYLRNTAVPAVREGETVIALNLVPGLLKYYKSLGLIPDSASVIEVEPQISASGEVLLGYPYTDPLAILSGHAELLDSGKPLYLVPTYSNVGVNEQANSLGLKSIDRPDSVVSNNKAMLREASGYYDIPMLPGTLIRDEDDLQKAVDSFGRNLYGVWIKFPTGSGGDLVRHIKTLNQQTLRQAIADLRGPVLSSFERGNFSVSGESFWPEAVLSPASDMALVVESDARNHGEVVTNGSNHFTTSKSGEVNILGYFQQIITEDGEYLGSRPYRPSPEIEEQLASATSAVARYNMEHNQYYGIQGIDWFLIKDDTGRLKVYVVELNSRPIVSSLPVIIGEKLGTQHWLNTNVYTDTQIHSIEDYVETVGEDLAYGNPQDQGLVIPQSFRTLVTRRRTIPSPNFKVLILGKDPQHCEDIRQLLKDRGIRLTP